MEWVYPKSLKEYIKMEELTEKGEAKRYAEIYCENCRSYTGKRYSTYISIPDETVCPKCEEKLSECYRTAIIIYKMI